MIAFMAATAQAQAEATKAAQKAAITFAKRQPEVKHRGRKPSYSRARCDILRTMLNRHQGCQRHCHGRRANAPNGLSNEAKPGCCRSGAGDVAILRKE